MVFAIHPLSFGGYKCRARVILSDNVLWSGKVVEKVNPKDIDTKALLQYNKMLKKHPKLETVLLPIRDGLTISRVK